MPRASLALTLPVLFLAGCSAAKTAPHHAAVEPSPPRVTSDAPHTPSVSTVEMARTATTTPRALASASDLTATSVFDKAVMFMSTGEDGRIAVLVDEAGEIVPYRREQAKWQRLVLPASQEAKVGTLTAGIYFGRDNRPRLMGTRTEARGIVYLRFKDDTWRPELREIGPLGKDGPESLFGVLGEADPEVVCRVDDRCLIKSRKGWQEARPSLSPAAVVRAFGGKGYAVTRDGAYRAESPSFVSLSPASPWKDQPSGFWIGESESLAVVETQADALFTRDSSGAWKTETVPIDHPTDVAGPPNDRFVTGANGLIHSNGADWSRVSGVSGALDRVIIASWGVVVAGRAGVFLVTRKSP